jgi:predicted transcriptional regulator of viral defense system
MACGLVERVARGMYRWSEPDVTENHSLALVARAIPDGVVCLLSALRFHNLTTQNPFQVWVAVDAARGWVPSRQVVPLKVIKASEPTFRHGVERHRIEGVWVKVYSVAKTVADCFKHRNKVGLDVALEALRESWRERRFTIDRKSVV